MAEEVVVKPDTLEAEEAAKIPAEKRTPAQERIIQLVSQRKAVEAERDALKAQFADAATKLAMKEAAETEQRNAAELAAATSKKDFEAIQARIQQEADAKVADADARYQAQQDRVMERAGKMVLATLAIQNGMTNPDYIRLFDCEIELDPDTLEVTAEGRKQLDTDFAAFKKANPGLFGGTSKQIVKSPDGGPARILTAVDKFDKGLAKEMSPIELMTAGLQKQMSGR